MALPVNLFDKLNTATNKMAEEIKRIRTKMTGRGINPGEAPLIEMRLLEVENKLRMLGANPDDPVPFN